MRWFHRVSHPLIVDPTPVPEYVVPRPVYYEILVEQSGLDILPIHCRSTTMRDRVEHAMEIPEVVSNPFFFSILEGLWT